MIVFENDGEIDLRAISQFGINVKESDSPIGFFGTGLKYALAVLMREGHEVIINSGENVCIVSKKKDDFRGKSFEFITATTNGTSQMLGFTTELGKNWPMWAAYRELACNAIDEHGEAYDTDTMPIPQSGKTSIVIIGDAFEKEHFTRGNNILQDKPFAILPNMEVRHGESNSVFYRGIRVHDANRMTMYRYNLLSGIELTEDRTAKNSPNYKIAMSFLACDNETILMKVLSANSDWLEHAFDYHGWGVTPSAAFISAVGKLMQDKITHINPTALRVWREATNKKEDVSEVKLSTIEQKKLSRAIVFVERHGYEVSQYNIKVVEALGDGVLALADEGKIYLTKQLFNIGGATKLASCLIEEYLHLKHGFDDCSRSMQTYLFEKLVSVLEELQGEEI